MIRNFVHLFCTFLALSSVFSQDGKIVQIKGFAPSYVGQTISVLEIEDYLSMSETRIASTNVLEDSTFTLSFYLKETQKLLLRTNKNKCFLYAQPGSNYDLYIPEKDKYEPYRPDGNSIELTFFELDSMDINYRILQFQRWSDDVISNYYYLRNIKPIEFAQQMESFKSAVDSVYQLKDTLNKSLNEAQYFFNTFVLFSIASIDNIQYAAERNRYEKHDFFIKYSPVAYRNDAYMEYIKSFYEKMIPRLSMETNNRLYLGLLKSSPTLIMKALGNEYTLINMRIREIVMIKALSEEFYSKDFPQTNILAVLDSVANHSLFQANAVIAKNMINRLTELSVGGKAPDFVLKTDKGETITLESLPKKHIYIHFYDPSSQKNTIELEPLIKLHKTYKEDITFITVYPENVYSTADTAKFLNTIPWTKCQTDKTNPIWKNYKVSSYPTYILLDGYGYVVGAPALSPMPDGQYQTIDKSFFFIQRTNKELRGKD